MNDNFISERKSFFVKGVIKILLGAFSFVFLMALSIILEGKFGGFPSMFLSIASFFAVVIFSVQGFGILIKISSLKKETQDSIESIKVEKNWRYASNNNLNSVTIAVATISTVVAVMTTMFFPFGSISFSLGREVQLILTVIAGPVSFFLLKEKRSVGRFFVMHFISTIVLGRVFEVLLVVSIISWYGF